MSATIATGPKARAQFASIGAKIARPMTETMPPMNEPMAAMPSAGPARPCFAIW